MKLLQRLRRWLFGPTPQETAEEFARTFPGRCMICSYHQYGYGVHHSDPLPPEHDCIEALP
jgi:hypothetical protein